MAKLTAWFISLLTATWFAPASFIGFLFEIAAQGFGFGRRAAASYLDSEAYKYNTITRDEP